MLINTSNTHIPLIFSDFVFNALSHKNPFQIQLISPPNPSRPYQQPVGLKLVCCSSLLQKGLHSYNNHPINTFFSLHLYRNGRFTLTCPCRYCVKIKPQYPIPRSVYSCGFTLPKLDLISTAL